MRANVTIANTRLSDSLWGAYVREIQDVITTYATRIVSASGSTVGVERLGWIAEFPYSGQAPKSALDRVARKFGDAYTWVGISEAGDVEPDLTPTTSARLLDAAARIKSLAVFTADPVAAGLLSAVFERVGWAAGLDADLIHRVGYGEVLALADHLLATSKPTAGVS